MHSNLGKKCFVPRCRGVIAAFSSLSVVLFPVVVLAQDNSITNVSATTSPPSNAISASPATISSAQRAVQLNEQAVKLIFDGKQSQGRDKITEALKLDPENATVLYNYAGILLTEGKSRDAVDAMEKAVKSEPGDLALWNRLAEAHFANSDIDSAIEKYEKIVSLDPKFDQAMFRLGTLYGMRQQWDRSEATLRKALDTNKEDSRILANLGSVLVLREKFQEAIDVLGRAHFDTPNAEVEMSLAIAYDGIKNAEKALHYYISAQKLGLKDDGLAKRIAELKNAQTK